METTTVLAAVDEAFRRVPGLAAWDDPHAGDRVPAEEEYSRVTAPERYRVVGARADAWCAALVGLGLATAEPAPPVRATFLGPSDDGSGDRGDDGAGGGVPPWAADASVVRLVPRAPGALPLVVDQRPLEGVPGCDVRLGVGEPPLVVAVLPDCGCDACDYGSAVLLAALDTAMLEVVADGFLSAEGPGWWVRTTRMGWSGSTAAEAAATAPRDLGAVLDAARAGEAVGTRVLRGEPWS